jgi:hypothetical protein
MNREVAMNEDGTVSLWLGNAPSREAFDEALDVQFSEDGDFLGSRFSRAFNIGYYDEGLKEAEYREQPATDLQALLEGVSYADVVIPRFLTAISAPIAANCFVLLYDYRHVAPHDWAADGSVFRYAGSVKYR